MIAYHPAGGRHVANYYKISSANGIIKIVGQGYVYGAREKAIIILIFGG